MAHVYKRGARWYGSWKGPDGDRERKVLPGVTTKRDAERVALQKEQQAWAIRENGAPRVDNSAAVEPLVEGFLLHKLATTAYETARHYAGGLADTLGQFKIQEGRSWPPRKQAPFDEVRQMARTFHPGALGIRSVAEITLDRWEQYVNENRAALSNRSLNIRITSLKSLLTWARKGGKIASNPLVEAARVGKPRRDVRFLSAEQVEKLLAASPEPEQTVWLFFVSTGLRKREFIRLRWPAIYLDPVPPYDHGFVRVLAETSKGKRQRDIPLTPDLRARLDRLKASAADSEAGHVFVNGGGRPMANNLPRKLAAALKRAGLDRKAVSLHGLRHTFATGLLLNGANIVTVSKLLGHVNVTQTLNTYAHCMPQNLQEAMTLLPFRVPTESQDTVGHAQVVAC